MREKREVLTFECRERVCNGAGGSNRGGPWTYNAITDARGELREKSSCQPGSRDVLNKSVGSVESGRWSEKKRVTLKPSDPLLGRQSFTSERHGKEEKRGPTGKREYLVFKRAVIRGGTGRYYPSLLHDYIRDATVG